MGDNKVRTNETAISCFNPEKNQGLSKLAHQAKTFSRSPQPHSGQGRRFDSGAEAAPKDREAWLPEAWIYAQSKRRSRAGLGHGTPLSDFGP